MAGWTDGIKEDDKQTDGQNGKIKNKIKELDR